MPINHESNTGEPSSGIWGPGFHLSTVGDHGVECPICKCYNEPDYLFKKLGNRVYRVIRCQGCKSKLHCILNMNGSFTLTEY